MRITFNHPGVRFNEPGFTFNDFSGPARRKTLTVFVFTDTPQISVCPPSASPPVRATFNQPFIRFNEPGYTFNDMLGPRKHGAPRVDVLTVVERVFVSPPGAGTAAGAWDTSDNRDLAIATINNLKTRVDQLETKLQALGLLT